MSFPAGPWCRVINWSKNSEAIWRNVLWYQVSGTPTTGFDINALALAMESQVDTAYSSPLNTTNGVFLGTDVYYNNGTYTFGGHYVAASNGNEASDELPSEAAVVVRLQSDHGGPSGRGRIFIHGLCSDNTIGSKLSSAGRTLYQAIGTAIKTALTNQGLTLTLALYSPKDSVLRTVTSVTVEDVLGHRTKERPIR